MTIDVERNIEAIFALSPMQQGMLFHSLKGPEEELYFEQACCTIQGDLNAQLFHQAWQHIIDRHAALRAAFVWEDLDEPLQIIGRNVQLPWQYLDWSGIAAEEQQSRLEQFLADDRQRGFDIAVAPLMRQTLIRKAHREYWFVSSHHHMLMDGWSVAIVFQDALETYEHLCRGELLPASRPRSYQHYITWLQQQDQAQAEAFWRDMLAGFINVTNLPLDRGVDQLTTASAPHAEQHRRVSPGTTLALQSFARQHKLTLNTLVQGAWALLLSRYSGQSDVVFGATVSGRPTDLAGVEQIVGLFINTLPVRAQIDPKQTLLAWLRQLQEQQAEARHYGYSPLMQIQKRSSIPHGTPLFESIVVFENYPIDSVALTEQHGGITLEVMRSFERNNFPLTLLATPGTGLLLQVAYDQQRFDAGTITGLLDHLETLLDRMMVSADQRVTEISMLTAEEWEELVVTRNATQAEYPRDACFHHLLARQVARTPDAIAVSFVGTQEQQLTYRQLDQRTNQLAHQLQQLGVGPNVPVALCFQRSLDLLVALLAVFKAGGAFLPLDPAFPAERIAFTLQDTQAPVLLTQAALLEMLPSYGGTCLCIDRDWDALVSGQPTTTPSSSVTAEDLAYVIYTSGSTGRPKGVLVPHRGLINYLAWGVEAYGAARGRGAPVHASIAADAIFTGLFMPLLAGTTTVIFPEEQPLEALAAAMQQERFSLIKITPSQLSVLSHQLPASAAAGSVGTLVVGAEQLHGEVLSFWQQHAPDTVLINEYGPTETVVGCSVYQVPPGQYRSGAVPIGLPIPNLTFYVLDRYLQPVPVGVPGELYIGGDGVAWGYLNRPDLTAEKFIPDPFAGYPLGVAAGQSGARLYKTGDLVRYLADRAGNIEFLGRQDDQVKIRGYRVELGEVETVIRRHPAIFDTVVLAREDVPGDRRLVAYVVPRADASLTVTELQRFVQEQLPGYMVPAAMMLLEALPLAPHGKIDRKRLPAPDQTRPSLEHAFVAPRTDCEALLAAVWSRVLRLERVGVYDNFFELGGDSILSLQIVSQVNAAGLRVTPRQVFLHRTIAELAAALDTPPVVLEAEQLSGAVPLTPIQHWLFDQALVAPHHDAQVVLLTVQPALAPALLERAVQHLIQQHDALRLRYIRTDGGWQQHYSEVAAATAFEHVTLPATDAPISLLERLAAEQRASLDLTHGPLARFVSVDLGAEQGARLLIVIHDLVVDSVSWRVLLDDLQTICQALTRNQEPRLLPKTTSYQRWAERLVDYAGTEQIREQFAYWESIVQRSAARLAANGTHRGAAAQTLSLTLEAEATRLLLQELPKIYRTQAGEILLTALSLAFAQCTSVRTLLIDLETQEREALFDDLDLSRTVGRCTSLFPFALPLDPGSSPAQALKLVKAELRRVPTGGSGYGLLRYIQADSQLAGEMRAWPQAEISFSYQGRLALNTDGLLSLVEEMSNSAPSPRGRRSHLLNVTGLVMEDRLTVAWTYDADAYQSGMIAELADAFTTALHTLIAHSRSHEAAAYIPSDFPLAKLNQAQLDRLFGVYRQIEDIYPLSPTQQGMLFHSLYAPESGVYFDQVSIVLKGTLDYAAFARAWQKVIGRHSILRTVFAWEGLDEPLQIAHQQIELPLAHDDWSSLSASEQVARLDEFLRAERSRGFVLDTEVPLRLTLIRLDEHRHRFVLSFHHLLIDGWSVSSVFQEFLICYAAFCRGHEPELPSIPGYRDYIAWLQAQDYSQLQQFWRSLLRGFKTPTPLGAAVRPQEPPTADEYGRQFKHLDANTRARLQGLASQHALTLNTLVLGTWALVLSAYSRQDDLVFGVTLSGRPPTLPDAQSIVGMFITTLPFRVQITTESTFWSWLQVLQDRMAEVREYEYSSLAQVQSWSELPRHTPLFENIFVFDNYDVHQTIVDSDQLLELGDGEVIDQGNYPLSVVVGSGQQMTLAMGYDRRRFADAEITYLLTCFQTLLERIATEPNNSLALLRPSLELKAPGATEPPAPGTSIAAQLEQHSNLTRHQQLIWIGHQLQPDEPVYNLSTYYSLPLPIDVARFRQAFQLVVDQSDALRTVIEERDGIPQQRVLPSIACQLEFLDLSQADDPEAAFQAWLAPRYRAPFQLDQRLFDSALIKVGPNRFHWYLCLFHIIGDGLSMQAILDRVDMFYARLAQGQPVDDVISPAFQHYVEQERRNRSSDRYLKAKAYWQAKFARPTEPINFYGKPPHKRTSEVRRVAYRLDAATSTRVKATAEVLEGRTNDLTLFYAFAAMLCVYLHKASQSKRLVIGFTSHNRLKEHRGTIGFFMQIVPLEVVIEPGDTFLSLADKIKAEMNAALRNSQYVVENPISAPHYDVIFNYHKDYDFHFGDHRIAYEWVHTGHGNESLAFQVRDSSASDRLQLDFDFHCDIFSEERQRQAIQHFVQVVEAFVADRAQPIDGVSLLSPDEQRRILVEFNQNTHDFPYNQTFAQLFEAQVAKTPHALAVSDNHEALTYAQLNARAECLAGQLQALGVGPGALVSLLGQRSVNLLTAILGVFKAGGAYLPLDPHHPPQRIGQIVSQSKSVLVLTDQEFTPTLELALAALPEEQRPPIRVVNDIDWNSSPRRRLPVRSEPHDLAYVIYTSGSTGVPKGVMVEQVGMVNHLYAKIVDLRAGTGDIIAQTASQCFDISVWQFLTALLVGGSVRIIDDETVQDPRQLLDLVERSAITILETVPSLLRALLDGMTRQDTATYPLTALRWLLLTGEALPPDVCRQWFAYYDRIPVVNAYGPTECSDDVTHAFIFQALAEDTTTVPIGKAIANTQLYIVDPQLQPLPIGVAGELCVGGIGVGRGYLHAPERTAAVFIPDPFSGRSGARLYKTGDLARFLADGSIEYLGRIDHQVKIRGFRIELGEIEAALLQTPGIRDGIVIVREDLPGVKQLVAYVVAQDVAALRLDALRAQLASRLPEYMVPSAFVVLDALPLSSNGKVDRKALPAPDRTHLEHMGGFVEPQTPVEQTLAAIWAEVLGLPRVGVHDNFFSLGGDSILSIQVVARARQAGIQLTPKHIFQLETIAQLATVVGTTSVIQAEQGPVVGELSLGPIQHWFFDLALPEAHHFNQSMLLTVQQDLSPALLKQALQQLISHHDILRTRFVATPSGWQARIEATDSQFPLAVHDLTDLPQETQRARIEELAAQEQASLNLSSGPVVRAVFFRLGDHSANRLLLIFHHLVIDGVSWRIVLEDLDLACARLLRGQAVQLPSKTTSFKQWAERLSAYAQSAEARQESAYWLAQAGASYLPIDLPAAPEMATQATTRSIVVTLSVEETQALLQEVPQIYHTQINDVLLTALTQSFSQWTGSSSLLLTLEGHGREDLFPDVDVSRTVGWFTSFFPVLLDLTHADGPGAALKTVKEQLRQTPGKGIGYSILRYLSRDRALTDQLAALPQPEISFNYLGQFDQSISGTSVFAPAPEATGPETSPRNRRPLLLDVLGQIVGGQLRVRWYYSDRQYHRQTIERLAQDYAEALRALIAHCQQPEAGGYTPSDFPLARLSQPQIDNLIGADRNIEDLYPLTPMQQAMVLHSVLMPDSIGFIQDAVEIHGSFQAEAFRQAWQNVVNRHAILRTEFRWEGIDTPLQVVRRHVAVAWEQDDWRGISRAEQESRLTNLLHAERKRGFDLSRAPLARLILIQCDEDTFFYVQSLHHVLLDGWCRASLQNEVFAYYRSLVKGRDLRLEHPRPYREYIAWLQEQNPDKAESFWRDLLRGFKVPTRLVLEDAPGDPGVGHIGEEQMMLSRRTTELLQKLARQHQVTLNTLVQGSWAMLLSAYSGATDVVFGITVSGRPAELPGVSSMMGIFINNLPLRVSVVPGEPLGSYFRRLRTQQLELQQYEFTPLADIQRWSEIPWNAPLFESLLVFENFPGTSTDGDEQPLSFQMRLMQQSGSETSTPLTMIIDPVDELKLTMLYNPRRFGETAIRRVLAQYQLILEQISTYPDGRVADIHLLTETERNRLDIWSRVGADAPEDLSITSLFEAQVAQAPEAMAIVMGDLRLTYGEVQNQIDQLVQSLEASGIESSPVVGLCVESPLAFVLGLLAVAKAGGAWMRLDPALPTNLHSERLARHGVRVVLTQLPLLERLSLDHPTLTLIDIDQARVFKSLVTTAARNRHVDGLACVIEDPRTQQPITISHQALALNILGVQSETGLDARDGIYMLSSQRMSPVGADLLLPLLSGARLVLAPQHSAIDPEHLSQVLTSDITVLYGAPETWHRLASLDWPGDSFRAIWSSGGKLDASAAALLRQRCAALWTLYQPGEIGLWAAAQNVSEQQSALSSRPLPHTRLSLLDAALRPLPLGIAGEIYLGGAAMPRICEDAGGTTASASMWATGDLGRFNQDGQLELLGRIDRQIMLHGYRVDLGAVERALKDQPALDAVVMLREDTPGEQRLVAYIVAYQQPAPVVQNLRAALRDCLPEPMIPSDFIFLDAWPLTEQGTLDRDALPVPALIYGRNRLRLHDEILETHDIIECQVTEIWERILNIRPIGSSDDFFDLGGNSLMALRLMGEIAEHCGVDLPMSVLFEDATIARLAQRIREYKGATHWSPVVEIQPRGEKPPFFCVHGVGGNVLGFVDLARHLEPDQPFYGIQTAGLDGQEAPPSTIEAMAGLYIDEIRRVCPEGPYLLGGLSFGGYVAFEMARQLQAQGLEVGLLVLLDTWAMSFEGRLLHAEVLRDDATVLLEALSEILAFYGHTHAIGYADLQAIPPAARIDYLVDHIERMEVLPPSSLEQLRRVLAIHQATNQALRDYLPQDRYPGQITIMRAQDLTGSDQMMAHPALGTPALLEEWATFSTCPVAIHDVPGTHVSMMLEPNVQALAAQLTECINHAIAQCSQEEVAAYQE